MKELVYLVTLAEEESISRAAERLYMAQSSLSQFLHQFEAELGTKLFVRTSKGITPTYSGKCFIEHAGEILRDYQKAKNELWDNENLAAGKVVLGISSFRGRRMLPKVLKQFQEIYPNVKVQVVEAHSMRLEELLLDGKLDIAIIAMPVSKIKNSVEILKKDEILLAVNKEHPVTKIMHPLEDSDNYWISLKEASEYKMIMSGYDTILGSFSRKMFTEQKLKYQSDHNDISAAWQSRWQGKDLELHLHTSPVRKNMRISGICGSEKRVSFWILELLILRTSTSRKGQRNWKR